MIVGVERRDRLVLVEMSRGTRTDRLYAAAARRCAIEIPWIHPMSGPATTGSPEWRCAVKVGVQMVFQPWGYGPVVDEGRVDDEEARAEDRAHTNLAGYLTSVMQHCELAEEHFKHAKGYESYGNAVDLLRAIGLDAMCDMYLGVQAWGTPDDIIDKLRARREVIGEFDLTCCFRYAGLPYEDAERSMRTFAERVLPALRLDPVPAT